jgi:hypothetical protein
VDLPPRERLAVEFGIPLEEIVERVSLLQFASGVLSNGDDETPTGE